MNALSFQKHFRLLNGTHWVLLCNPSVLATESNSVPNRSLTSCPACFKALSDDAEEKIKREVFKRMNDIGKPRR